MSWRRRINDGVLRLVRWERRVDPYFRPWFDRLFRAGLQWLVQAQLRVRRRPDGLALAEERVRPGEAEATADIIESMTRFLHEHYADSHAERAGNTKTYGVVRGELVVHDDLPAGCRQGLFASPSDYPAWVRFAGPGPLAPADLDDNGVLSIGVKVMGVSGAKLLDDETATQDLTGISAPTFTTPDVFENALLQEHIGSGTPLLYFLNPRRSHLTDLLMQGLHARTHTSPLDTSYWSCAAYLLGPGQAMQYRFVPLGHHRATYPRHPSRDYLREAMASSLRSSPAEFALMVQPQTDPFRMPVENASVVWPERLSPPVHVATLRLPAQEFDSPEQLAFADSLSINPWHALPEHRPLGSQNRARRAVYQHLSGLRQAMNGVAHVEPTGAEAFSVRHPAHGSPAPERDAS